jgi:hypothetical protein
MVARVFKKPATGTSNFLRERCTKITERLLSEHASRLRTRQNNLDSGIPLEELFRRELAALVNPYVVDVGRVVDKEGFTAGECDVVLLDPRLSPLLLPGPTEDSRHKWFAFEATYGIVEVKQTLTLGALDADQRLIDEPKGSLFEACAKIFAYKQLSRTLNAQLIWGTNAPLGYVFFYDSESEFASDEEKDALLREFKAINSLVAPEARVNGLFVLDKCAVTWSFLGDAATRTFSTLQHPIETPRPIWLSFHPTKQDTLYWFFTQLWSVLARTQLGGPDLLEAYGGLSLRQQGLRALPCSAAAAAESAAG